MHKLYYNKIEQKTHFIPGASSYMFRQQGAIIRQFLSNTGLKVQQVIQALCAHTSIIKFKCPKMLKLKLHINIAVTLISHKHKPPLLYIYSCYTYWTVYTNARSNV